MKRTVALLLAALSCFAAGAEKILVNISVEGEANNYPLLLKLEKRAKENAVEKYIRRLNSAAPENILRQAVAEADGFVTDCYKESGSWTELGRNLGQLSGRFSVMLDDAKLNSYLEKLGFKVQGRTELVILEEPPSMGQIELNDAFGSGIDGKKFYLTNYTLFQRRTRDAIIRNLDRYGFDVKLLADRPEFKKYLSDDGTLLGVRRDSASGELVKDAGLLDDIRNTMPDTLALYYRIDTLAYLADTRTLKVSISLNIKNLSTGVTKSVGAQDYALVLTSTGKEAIIDGFARCVSEAVQLLMNEAGPKMNALVTSINNTGAEPVPARLLLNGALFGKTSARSLYELRKTLIAQKLTTDEKSAIRGSNLTVESVAPMQPQEFYFEHLLPLLEKAGLKLNDDNVTFDGSNVIVKP